VSDYTADRLPEEFDAGALYDELKRVEDAFRGRQGFQLVNFDKYNVEPTKPQEQDVAYADGSNWNPGQGAGLYIYINSQWEPLVSNPQLTAFGEQSVAQALPVVQLQFPYNINAEIVDDRSNGGTLTTDSSRAKLSTGAAANQSATLASRTPLKYDPGQGGLVRFTSVFDTGTANSTQVIGLGDAGDGYFFGYNGTSFGVMRRHDGVPEIRELEITTGSSHAENITITLDGDANTVAVTNTADVTLTANEIAADTGWLGLGTGWRVFVYGDTVVFESLDTATHSGTYSITATSAAGTYTQALTAVAATEVWVAQASWSNDPGDGTKQLPAMDWQKGNVFQIRYQWLGFGLVSFYVENPTDGNWCLVHNIEYANANTTPSVQNPTLPLCAHIENQSNTTDLVMYTSSMAGFVEGGKAPAPVKHGFTRTLSISSSTEVPVLSLHNQHIHNSKLNRTRVKLTFVGITNESGKPAIVHFDVNPTLTGASFSSLEAAHSVMDTDIAATATTGGDNQFSIVLPSGTTQIIPLSELNFYIPPSTTFTISAGQTTTGTASVVTVSVNFEEHF